MRNFNRRTLRNFILNLIRSQFQNRNWLAWDNI